MLYIDWQPSIEVFRVGIFSLKWYSLLWMFGLMIAYIIVKREVLPSVLLLLYRCACRSTSGALYLLSARLFPDQRKRNHRDVPAHSYTG